QQPARRLSPGVQYHVAHSVRGRLRVRYPVQSLKNRRETLESSLRAIPGVRTVASSTVTGSVRIEYDPFALAERSLMEALHQLEAATTSDRVDREVVRASGPRLDTRRAPLLSLIGSSAVLATTCFPVPAPVLAGLVLASDIPALVRAAAALGRRHL